MAYRKACEEIEAAWDTLSARWSAEIKSPYFTQLYLPLLTEAEGMYRRNEDLESYAENCVRSLHV